MSIFIFSGADWQTKYTATQKTSNLDFNPEINENLLRQKWFVI